MCKVRSCVAGIRFACRVSPLPNCNIRVVMEMTHCPLYECKMKLSRLANAQATYS